jgi:hypothetical protein
LLALLTYGEPDKLTNSPRIKSDAAGTACCDLFKEKFEQKLVLYNTGKERLMNIRRLTASVPRLTANELAIKLNPTKRGKAGCK